MIRVVLPYHLRNLAQAGNEIQVEVEGPITVRSVLDALELRYPMLRGTIRDHGTLQRRPFLRFFACEQDLSHEPPDALLSERVASGEEPFIIIGAIAGWLAGQIVKGYGLGLVGNIVVGIIGAIIAGWLLPMIGFVLVGGILAAIVNAVIGAVILLIIVGFFKK